ncbi:MAG: hypothetical protein M1838_005178 [Thelocarpon superellum]|nr:MAG: hypothetical protein M1838_005178 [Thelocarpon superellum]
MGDISPPSISRSKGVSHEGDSGLLPQPGPSSPVPDRGGVIKGVEIGQWRVGDDHLSKVSSADCDLPPDAAAYAVLRDGKLSIFSVEPVLSAMYELFRQAVSPEDPVARYGIGVRRRSSSADSGDDGRANKRRCATCVSHLASPHFKLETEAAQRALQAQLAQKAQQAQQTSPSPAPMIDLDLVLEQQMEIGESSTVEDFYRARFHDLQQLHCKVLAKAWIKKLEPRKQTTHPYKDGDDAAPDWWPAGVRHREPDHIKKEPRIKLLLAILRAHKVSVEELKSATDEVSLKWADDRKDILASIYRVAMIEEQHMQGGLGSGTIVHVPPEMSRLMPPRQGAGSYHHNDASDEDSDSSDDPPRRSDPGTLALSTTAVALERESGPPSAGQQAPSQAKDSGPPFTADQRIRGIPPSPSPANIRDPTAAAVFGAGAGTWTHKESVASATAAADSSPVAAGAVSDRPTTTGGITLCSFPDATLSDAIGRRRAAHPREPPGERHVGSAALPSIGRTPAHLGTHTDAT